MTAFATSWGMLSARGTTSEGASLTGAAKTEEVVNTKAARKRVEAEEIIVEQTAI
jgi:hypothetical protein